jgi:glycosyltransferase involved in cell wall biosynthesis
MKKKAIFIANTGFALFNFRLPLMKYLANKGWSILAIANDEADYAYKFKKYGFKFIDIPINHKGQNPIRDLLFLYRLLKIFRRERPDLVHNFTIKPVIFGSLAARLAGVPSIVNTITGLGYTFDRGGWLRFTVTLLYKLALTKRTKTIFQNTYDQWIFHSKRIVPIDQSHVILGSGVDTKRIQPQEKNSRDDEITFAMVSRMLWSKGVREFVNRQS